MQAPIGVVLWATLPSPCPFVTSLLARIRNIARIPLPTRPQLASPIPVVPLSSVKPPLPISYLYVGHGASNFPLTPSPWLNPFIYDNYDLPPLEMYSKYLDTRPDSLYLAGLLSKYHSIVCDCPWDGHGTFKCMCHASILSTWLVSEPCWTNPNEDWSKTCNDDEELDDICGECVPPEGSLEEINETIRGAQQYAHIDRGVGHPSSWQALIARVRKETVKCFWELFAGCGILTAMMAERGWTCAVPIDILYNQEFNLLNPQFVSVVIGLILEGRFALVHVGPPCSSFSMAVNRFMSYAMRSDWYPEGFPWLPPHRREKVDLGNALAQVALLICTAQEKAKGLWQWEQPLRSFMYKLKEVEPFLARPTVYRAVAHICYWSAPWM